MGARWYDPATGRFISPDPIIPDATNPQSYNRYSYVFNRPTFYNDPSGHCPWCFVIGGGVVIGGFAGFALNPALHPWNPPAMITTRVAEPITSNIMTSWLRNQMVTNAQSQVVQNIHSNWRSLNPVNNIAALQAFTALVGTGATWDFKVDIEDTTWYRRGDRDVIIGGRTLNFDAVANIHFGFVGRAAGFSGGFLVKAAGVAQWQRWQKTGDPHDQGVCNLTYYCDHPFATWTIRFGAYLYELYGDRLNQLDDGALGQALEDYIAANGEPPDPPPGAVVP
jgi:hypothetical protein